MTEEQENSNTSIPATTSKQPPPKGFIPSFSTETGVAGQNLEALPVKQQGQIDREPEEEERVEPISPELQHQTPARSDTSHTSERAHLSRSDIVSPSDNAKTRRCMHEHWKDCQDYPEAHKWVGKDPEYDEEEQVRALVWSQGTDEEDYIGEGEALRIAQLVSGMLVHAEPSSAGTSTTGRMKVM
ncbi:hypothetical protein EI94DRAFT_1818626 [Lactarius quietus]|nr:hypothetical protein EI94DRAFT_1818626 [Lactarius quietus]